MSDNNKSRKPRTIKTIKQKIVSAQMRLNRLQTKEKSLSRNAETHLKIIPRAEVAAVFGCKVEVVDKGLIPGQD
jgi:hypothetical protein